MPSLSCNRHPPGLDMPLRRTAGSKMGAVLQAQVSSLTDSPDPDQILRFKTGLAGLDNSFFAAFAKCARRRLEHA